MHYNEYSCLVMILEYDCDHVTWSRISHSNHCPIEINSETGEHQCQDLRISNGQLRRKCRACMNDETSNTVDDVADEDDGKEETEEKKS